MTTRPPTRRKGRVLRPAEDALWRLVAQDVAPLPGRAPPPLLPETEPQPAIPQIPSSTELPLPPPRPPQIGRPASFDITLKRRLARGQRAIDASIDLHGMTQAQAHTALLRFVHHQVEHGASIALVITGKGERSAVESDSGRGVLRRLTPLWLKQPEFLPYVVAVQAAHFNHGGDGALYIHLRRARKVVRP